MAVIRPGDPVRVVMSTPVATVKPDVPLADLAASLEAEGVGAVVVMSGDRLDGVVSERDIVHAVAAGGDPTEVWAADVMAEDPVFVDLDEPIVTVATRMIAEGVRHVPVVCEGHVVGVVSIRDALRVLTEAWRAASEGSWADQQTNQ